MTRHTFTLRFRAVNRDTFLDIISGKKVVETRAATERYKNIKKGDLLILVCGKEKFKKEVKKVKIFKTVASMIKVYPPNKIMPGISSVKELQKAYYSYPHYREKIKKYGLVVLEL